MANVRSLASNALTDSDGILRPPRPGSPLVPPAGPASQAPPATITTPSAPTAAGSMSGGSPRRPTAANEATATTTKGSSYVVAGREKFLLRDAVSELGAEAASATTSGTTYKMWPRLLASSSTTWGRSRTTCTRTTSRRSSSASKASRSRTTSRRSSTTSATISRTRFMGLEPGTTKEDVVRCLDRWNEGDNGILDLSKAYRLKVGTGWLIPPCVLHAPGSLLTYEPQWGSRRVRHVPERSWKGRAVPRASPGRRTFPKEKHNDNRLPRRRTRLGEERRSELHGEQLPRADRRPNGRGRLGRPAGSSTARWTARQLFTSKELTLQPGREVHDQGWRRLRLDHGPGNAARSAKLVLSNAGDDPLRRDDDGRSLRDRQGGAGGVTFENTGTEPLVGLR